MVDSGGDEDDDDGEEGNGCFDLEEITDICALTFKDFQKPPGEDGEESSGDDEEGNDILRETAELQAKSIFERLGYSLDDEIPMDVFKHYIFHGDRETR